MPVSCDGGKWTRISSLIFFVGSVSLCCFTEENFDSSFGREMMLRLFWLSLMIKNMIWMQLNVSI